MLRVIRAHRAYASYRRAQAELDDSDDDDGPAQGEQEDAWLFVDLNYLMKLYARMQEKERMIALIFEVRTLPFSSSPKLTASSEPTANPPPLRRCRARRLSS